jgi:adenylate kinase family enzyme
MMKCLLAKLEDKMDANQKKAEADKEEMLARMKEDRKANQEELLARMDSYHEKRMAMFDAYEKSIMACLGQAEANTEKIEQDPGMMQSMKEH